MIFLNYVNSNLNKPISLLEIIEKTEMDRKTILSKINKIKTVASVEEISIKGKRKPFRGFIFTKKIVFNTLPKTIQNCFLQSENKKLRMQNKRKCTNCLSVLDSTNFQINKKGNTYGYCNKCRALKAKEWRGKTPEKQKELRKRHKNARMAWITKERKTKGSKLHIRTSIGNRIREAVVNEHRNSSTIELLGCSIEEVRIYLQSKFEDGMSWDNYGFDGWHIDHIKPCASFDLTKEEEQRKCFHYTNLQPLWAKDNFEKSDKLNWIKGE